MTPKELSTKIADNIQKWGFTNYTEIIGLIQQAKTEWCKEQRKNCLQNAKVTISGTHFQLNENSILTAPEPK